MFNILFKWTVSRGQDTYGYNICSIYVNGEKKGSTCGGGYDMKGTAMGIWIEKHFFNELSVLAKSDIKKARLLKKKRYYNDSVKKHYGFIASGYTDSNGKRIAKWLLDGGCGFSSMINILNLLGYKCQYISTNNKRGEGFYQVSKK